MHSKTHLTRRNTLKSQKTHSEIKIQSELTETHSKLAETHPELAETHPEPAETHSQLVETYYNV